jgi:hypothetical protein
VLPPEPNSTTERARSNKEPSQEISASDISGCKLKVIDALRCKPPEFILILLTANSALI